MDKSCTAIPQANDALSSLTKSLPISSSAGERRQVRLSWPAIVSCAFLSCLLLSAWATSLLCPQLTSLLPHSIYLAAFVSAPARPHVKNLFTRSKVDWLIVLPQRRQSQSPDFIMFVDCQADAVIRVSFNRRQSPPFVSVIEDQIRSQA